VFFALLGGFDAFGPVGLILGPLMLTVFLTLVEIYRDRYQPFLMPSALTADGQRLAGEAQGPEGTTDPDAVDGRSSLSPG
jgi:hypothetical protein